MKKEERDELCGEMGDKEDSGVKRDDEDDGRGMMNDEEESMDDGGSMMTTNEDKHLELAMKGV